MTRQQYIAELNQLLFYMTPWDKAAALDKYSRLFEESENEAALFNELGSPMKLAVTLHRNYEATPEPNGEGAAEEAVQETAAEEAAEVVSEETAEEEAAEAVSQEVSAEAEEAPEAEEPAAEEAVEEEAVAAQEAAEEETPSVEDSAEEIPAAEEAAEEVSELPAEEEAVSQEVSVEAEEAETEEPVAAPMEIPDVPAKEKIFSEIYNAATDAQSAVVIDEPAQPKTVRKARYLILIPYTILSVLIAIPVVAVLAVVNVVLFAAAIVCLCACLYLLILQLPAAVGIGNQLIYGGLAIVALTATIALGALGVWFAGVATAGFPRFLLEFGKKHGYREVEVQ